SELQSSSSEGRLAEVVAAAAGAGSAVRSKGIDAQPLSVKTAKTASTLPHMPTHPQRARWTSMISLGPEKCRGHGSACKEESGKLFDAAEAAHLHVRPHFGGVGLRNDHAAKAERGGLAGAQVGLRDAAHLAEKADLAEDDDVVRDGEVALRRDQRGDDAKVDGRLVDLQAAGEVDVD